MLAEFGLMDWLSMMGSFLLVIGLLVATLFLIKKMGPSISNASNKRLQILEVQNLGARQKLLLVSVNADQVLIGISPQGMTNLGSWPVDQQIKQENQEQVPEDSENNETNSSLGNFKQLLAQTVKKQKD
jgi:flagellar protein FliO/FliZ|tara:strand:+ start:295 stop:681 length:387 start_codon:yes stop_codon:yes gene_type:complete